MPRGVYERVTKKRIKLICKTCGEGFEVYPCCEDRKYCSRRCYRVARRGKKQRPRSEECSKKHSRAMIRYYEDPRNREKTGKAIKIAMNRPEVKEKKRIAFERRAEDAGFPINCLQPNFNFLTLPIFQALDKILHTRGRYGGTKVGEKKVGKYFVDYFNKKYQFIIEWNENWHNDNSYYPEGYDAKKRRYILARYPDYTYITIRQDRWFKKDSLTEEIAGKIVDYILKKLNGSK